MSYFPHQQVPPGRADDSELRIAKQKAVAALVGAIFCTFISIPFFLFIWLIGTSSQLGPPEAAFLTIFGVGPSVVVFLFWRQYARTRRRVKELQEKSPQAAFFAESKWGASTQAPPSSLAKRSSRARGLRFFSIAWFVFQIPLLLLTIPGLLAEVGSGNYVAAIPLSMGVLIGLGIPVLLWRASNRDARGDNH